MADMNLIGASVKRKEDYRFLTGAGTYTDDVRLDRQSYAYFLRSPHAHASIRGINTDKAKKAPGVLGVFTGQDIAAAKINGLPCGWLITDVNGQPMKDGIVVYLPKDTSVARQATGRIQSDGSFVLTTFKKADGAVPGDYDIVVYAYQPHPGEPKTRAEHEAVARAGGIKRGFVIPEKYVNPQTSGLSDTVNSDHSGFKRFELSG